MLYLANWPHSSPKWIFQYYAVDLITVNFKASNFPFPQKRLLKARPGRQLSPGAQVSTQGPQTPERAGSRAGASPKPRGLGHGEKRADTPTTLSSRTPRQRLQLETSEVTLRDVVHVSINQVRTAAPRNTDNNRKASEASSNHEVFSPLPTGLQPGPRCSSWKCP